MRRFLDRFGELGISHVLLQALDIDADLGCSLQRALGGDPLLLHERNVKRPVFVLKLGGHGGAGGKLGMLAEDRVFLHDDANVRVLLGELLDLIKSALAPAAVVIEELDDGDVALLVAEDEINIRAEQLGLVLDDQFLVFAGLGFRLLALELAAHLDQDLGVLDQVVANDALDFETLRLGHRGRCRRWGCLGALGLGLRNDDAARASGGCRFALVPAG